ncbi:uncharacterized protein [Temnothorax longispinosus]|uniref:uncharacterized protein isoform X2 n=1 Tax=Temnothorax longispinosus TaxID=300112 RepID=UPI003A992E9E
MHIYRIDNTYCIRMENNSNEIVTLILKEERFEVEKQKLIDKSHYFANLLSANFQDYTKTKHVINYDISSILLQDFIDWIHNDNIAFTSATSYDFKELDRLLDLLELSVLFAADTLEYLLVKDLTNRLEGHYFTPPKIAIEIWLLAQELNINVLRDLSLALCLDRFNELSVELICELSRENFLKLIGNINITATKSHLHEIKREWLKNHKDFTVSLKKDKKAKILPCIISCEHANEICKQYIHCWDGKDLLELTNFRNKFATGIMQITARRYDLYLCGGEYGIDSGMFNKKIWRYSLISKKWVHETVMPVERRHMITVFLKNKLYLVGGVGRDGNALDTVDIYDIYTGIWTSGAKIPTFSSHTPSYVRYMGQGMWSVSSVMEPVTLTSDSEYFIFKDTLIIYRLPYFYKYFPDKDVWKEIYLEDICELKRILIHTPILPLQTMSCYIDVVDQDKMVLKVVTDTCNVKGCNNIIKSCSYLTHGRKKRDMDKYSSFLTPFFREYDLIVLKPAALLYADCIVYNRRLHLHSIPIQDPRKFRSLLTKKNSARRFLNLLNPTHLHTTYIDHI